MGSRISNPVQWTELEILNFIPEDRKKSFQNVAKMVEPLRDNFFLRKSQEFPMMIFTTI